MEQVRDQLLMWQQKSADSDNVIIELKKQLKAAKEVSVSESKS